MSSDSTPPAEDKNLQSDNTDSESVDSDAYWEDYYKQRTPQIDPEELEKIREDKKDKKSPFSPDYVSSQEEGQLNEEDEKWYQRQKRLEEIYVENPELDDDEIYNKLDEEGNLEFVDSGRKDDDFERFQTEIDLDFVFEDEEETDE